MTKLHLDHLHHSILYTVFFLTVPDNIQSYMSVFFSITRLLHNISCPNNQLYYHIRLWLEDGIEMIAHVVDLHDQCTLYSVYN